MNILYLSDTGNIIGGGEFSLLAKLENIDRLEFRPFLAAPVEGSLTEAAKGLRVPLRIIPYKKVSNPFNIFSSFRVIRQIKDIILKDGIQLVHTNSSGGFAFLGAVAAGIMKKPFIWHVRTNIPEYFYDWLMGAFSTRVIIISESTRDRIRDTVAANKILLIYNGLNLDKFYAVGGQAFRKEIGYSDDDLLVGSVGRYHPIKGYNYFIRAAYDVAKAKPKAKFCIVGLKQEGDDKHFIALKRLVKKLGLADKLVFLFNREDVARIISAFDVFVIPSLREPFGRVVIEAMACEKPVVGFNNGGVPEIVVDGKTGFLVPPYRTEIMAEKIITLLNDRQLNSEFGRQGKIRVQQTFDIKSDMLRVAELYRELISEDRS